MHRVHSSNCASADAALRAERQKSCGKCWISSAADATPGNNKKRLSKIDFMTPPAMPKTSPAGHPLDVYFAATIGVLIGCCRVKSSSALTGSEPARAIGRKVVAGDPVGFGDFLL